MAADLTSQNSSSSPWTKAPAEMLSLRFVSTRDATSASCSISWGSSF